MIPVSRFSRPLFAGVAFAFLAVPVVAQAQAAPDTPPSAPANGPASAPASAAASDAAPAAASATSTELPAICTDRPTKSNAACAVETGHIQYEADIFNGSFLRLHGTTTDVYLATNPTLKYGVFRDVDIEANIAPYEVVRTSNASGSTTLGGVGDLFLRVKWNFYNTADGKLSIGAIPYVKAPIARAGIGNGEVEGGFLMPINYKLTDKITLTTVPEVDDFKDAAGTGRHLNTAQLVNVGYSLPHNVTVYGELYGDWNLDPSGTIRQYTADVAAAWGLTKYLQVDAGLNFGLNRYAPGVQAYFGVSQKF